MDTRYAVNQETLDVLIRARKAIAVYGWTRSIFGGEQSGMCSQGALNYASSGNAGFSGNWAMSADIRLRQEITEKYGYMSTPYWNDHYAQDRMHVIRMFSRAIYHMKKELANEVHAAN